MMTLFLMPLIEKMPVWEEIRQYQAGNLTEREACPAREERAGIKPDLHIVQ